MQFNENLKYSKLLSEYYHEDGMNVIKTILDSAPKLNLVSLGLNEQDGCHIESTGSLFGLSGTWAYDLKFDQTHDIESVAVSFSEEKSSREPFSDTYLVVLRSLPENLTHEKSPFKIMEFRLTRMHNYRFSAPHKALSVSDIASASQKEVISRQSVAIRHNMIVMVEDSKKVGSVLDTKINQYPLKTRLKTSENVYEPVLA